MDKIDRISFNELTEVVAAAGGRLYAQGGEFKIRREDGTVVILEVIAEN